MPVIPATGGRGRRLFSLRPAQGKISVTLSQKQNTNKRAGSVAQVVDACLTSTMPGTAKKKNKKEAALGKTTGWEEWHSMGFVP
jgi:hypothetical protein